MRKAYTAAPVQRADLGKISYEKIKCAYICRFLLDALEHCIVEALLLLSATETSCKSTRI